MIMLIGYGTIGFHFLVQSSSTCSGCLQGDAAQRVDRRGHARRDRRTAPDPRVSLPLSGSSSWAILGIAAVLRARRGRPGGLNASDTPLSGAIGRRVPARPARKRSRCDHPAVTFAGYLMARAKTAQRLVRMAEALLG